MSTWTLKISKLYNVLSSFLIINLFDITSVNVHDYSASLERPAALQKKKTERNAQKLPVLLFAITSRLR